MQSVFAHRVSSEMWIVESVHDQPEGRRSPYTRRTVWRVARESRSRVVAALQDHHVIQNGSARGHGNDPDRVPGLHVDEARSKVNSFYAGDDVTVDWGAFSLAQETDLQFEDFWQGTDRVRFEGDNTVPAVGTEAVHPGQVFEFRVRTLANHLELVSPDGDRVWIDGTDERLSAANWATLDDDADVEEVSADA